MTSSHAPTIEERKMGVRLRGDGISHLWLKAQKDSSLKKILLATSSMAPQEELTSEVSRASIESLSS